MEALLSHSFDYLSSSSPQKIRKGLRQVEGLLAQLCLSRTNNAANKRQSMLLLGSSAPSSPHSKKLSDLPSDPAFREFFKLQQSFQWNIAMRLVASLERLLGKESNGTNDLLIIQTLDLIQGVLLLHPPSRALFSQEIYMNLFLDLLDPSNCPAIQSSTIMALVTSLLDHPQNTRTFESIDGLLVITSLFKSRGTSREVKLKLVEFLYFYLMPENAAPKIASPTSATNTAILGGRGKEVIAAFERRRGETLNVSDGGGVGGNTGNTEDCGNTRTTEEKQSLLGRHLSNVQDLVEDLREGGGVFGAGNM
ncbi:uncharacterized protein Z519_06897 [Cladophialophora bantiana CBS 173.52]|uniref:Cell division control protein 14 n=1 Tax=Cladophialophora bantiana (strain ATCC 10958 / CBS 173.52 / CDC B-1940 / NIH 8579) TaxID=1442370 RepID=A0A0D2HIF8_CLAB1|nr:uncharacterized protein Z519_06897 [Cladophialophora bantiana CBS 173.52]KIW93048.1 hypothetical protein Z519_06897 [Cladophialophora bantiana CBS 173.52]